MSYIVKVRGYHGTDQEAMNAILAPGGNSAERFLQSENDSDWLGNGVYFFEDAPYRAQEWPMIRLPKSKRIQDPVVLCAELTLIDCLDLVDIRDAGHIAHAYPKMKAKYSVDGTPMPKNRGGFRQLDRYLINFAAGELENGVLAKRVACIRAAFEEGKPIVPGSNLYSHAHVQIVVCSYHTDVIGKVWQHTF